MCLKGRLVYIWNSQHSISAISTLTAIRLLSSPEAWTLGNDRPDRMVQLFPTFLSSHASQWSLGPRNWRNEFWCEKKIICVVFVVLLMCVRPAYALIFEFVKTIIMLWSASLWRVYASICEFVKTRYLLWFASLWRLYASISEFVKTICFD